MAAHPGVVQLLGTDGADPPAILRLRRASRGDLAALDTERTEVVAGLGATLATTLADMHEFGVTHGGIEPAHVLLDDDYRPMFCSFGRARTDTGAGIAARRQADVSALATLLIDRLPPGAPKRLTRVLLAGVNGRRGVSARWMARQLVAAVPNAALPGAALCPTDQRTKVRLVLRRRTAIVTAVFVAGFVVAVTGSAIGASGGASPPRCPAIDAGCRSQALNGGFLTVAGGRYQLTGAAGLAVLGRWGCGPVAFPAILDLATGEVWIFDDWATHGHAVAARALGRFAGARDLRVIPALSACDRLEVLWPHRNTTLSPERRR